MINTKELEKRWYKYKAKTFTFFLLILMIVILLPYLIYYIYSNMDTLSGSPSTQSPKENRVIEKSIVAPPKIPSPKVEKEQKREEPLVTKEVLLSPTIPILDMEDEKETKRVVKAKKNVTKHKKKLIKAKKSASLSAKEMAVLSGKDLRNQKKKINFSHNGSDYKEVMKKKFEENRNPREALLLAKVYYKENNYLQAEEWALRANKLDKNLDESWLLFAKSKAKLGKRKEALNILSSYYKKSKSDQARELISKIKARRI